jgi:methionyl aminopeptidase
LTGATKAARPALPSASDLQGNAWNKVRAIREGEGAEAVAIYLRRDDEIDKIRASCRIVAECFEVAGEAVRPGVRTAEIERLIVDHIASRGAASAFKGYRGYPAHTCISVNDQVVHGIPGNLTLREGDIVSIDIGVVKDDYFGDGARTFPVGDIDPEAARLIEVTRESLNRGCAKAQDGNRLGDISYAVQECVESAGFSVVRDLVGHGIGRSMHEEPQIPNFGHPRQGPKLRAGMVLAIEPMVNAGDWRVRTLDDMWTVVTEDGSLSAHFENTVAIRDGGPVVLTLV